MTYEEHERAAYMAGNLALADLYHRLDQLAQALGEALAALGSLREQHIDALAEVEGRTDALAEANDYAADLRRELDDALAEIGGLRDELILSNSHADELQRELDKATS